MAFVVGVGPEQRSPINLPPRYPETPQLPHNQRPVVRIGYVYGWRHRSEVLPLTKASDRPSRGDVALRGREDEEQER
jgi:hypothetical protein